jgi:hypothetical protein
MLPPVEESGSALEAARLAMRLGRVLGLFRRATGLVAVASPLESLGVRRQTNPDH